MNIIFDLDGTLIDSKLRLYRLFSFLVPEIPLSFDEYWSYKSNKISNLDILKRYLDADESRINHFNQQWMALIETEEYLALDTPFAGIESFLSDLGQSCKLYVCTARQFRQSTLDQLSRLNLISFFNQVLVTEQIESKKTLVLKHVADLNPQDWMVGDTGKDIQVGKALGIRTCAVLSGFLNEVSLKPYLPDLIIDRVTDHNFRDIDKYDTLS